MAPTARFWVKPKLADPKEAFRLVGPGWFMDPEISKAQAVFMPVGSPLSMAFSRAWKEGLWSSSAAADPEVDILE